MATGRRLLRVALLGAALAIPSAASAQSGSNGVYGGYVGSSAWFASMRTSAQNQAMLRQLGGSPSGDRVPVPPDYVEVAGQFTFPAGNPFPGGRVADLRIKCGNQAVDNVTRSPFLSKGDTPTYYTVLKKGQLYHFYWMAYFGGLQEFAAFQVPADASAQLPLVIAIDRKGMGTVQAAATAMPASPVAPPAAPTRR